MKKVIIYTTKNCPYCIKAKKLLNDKGIEYEEMCIDENPDLATEARQKSGGRKTVPQIFINEYLVGGCDDLYALHQQNELDTLLKE